MTISSMYRLKYIENDEVRFGSFAKLTLILYQLDRLLEKGMYCIVVDANGNEYKSPAPTAKPSKAIATPKYPSPKPMMIDAIAAHLNKPENVTRREKARFEDANQWAKLRTP